MASVLLSQQDILQRLGELNGWTLMGQSIQKTYPTQTFKNGVGFLVSIAIIADELNHHPDVQLAFKTITMTLTTHDSGGITELDFRLATRMDVVWQSL